MTDIDSKSKKYSKVKTLRMKSQTYVFSIIPFLPEELQEWKSNMHQSAD